MKSLKIKPKSLSDKIAWLEKHVKRWPVDMATIELYALEMEDNRKGFNELQILTNRYIRRTEKLEKTFLNLTSGGEKMVMPENPNTDSPQPDPRDLDGDGVVSDSEKRLYDFMLGIYNAQAGTIQHTQRNSLWTQLGTMVFLLVSTVLAIFIRN